MVTCDVLCRFGGWRFMFVSSLSSMSSLSILGLKGTLLVVACEVFCFL